MMNLKKSPRTCMLLLAAALLAVINTGCASQLSGHRPALFGATCSPVEHVRTQNMLATSAEFPSETSTLDLSPLFNATCIPQDEVTHLHLAMAFVDQSSPVVFDMIPLFGATASPAFRSTLTRIDRRDIVKREPRIKADPAGITVSAETD